jgi:predicted unusual protein kinase regulating ubiquinone biosynthesis (AarF/ABC1/UbiB family)
MSRRRRLPRRASHRAARVAGAFCRRATRHGSTRLANRFRDTRRAGELVELRHRETAAYLTATLGTLRGGAAKLGQLASLVDVSCVPVEYRELYRSELATLCDSAPAMSWPEVRQVLEDEWAAPPESVLEDLEHEPAAAASIGQVHRGTLADGRRVAVKVQYPRVADAFTAEVRSAVRLLRVLRGLAPALDTAALAAEVRGALLAELDYVAEGTHQALFARAYRGHPFIHVPDVDFPLTRRRVLVTEWVDGLRFAAVRELPRPQRDRFGEILFRFYFGAIALLGRFNADPHPGNYLLRPDGGVTFLDFGSVKPVTAVFVQRFVALIRAAAAGDPRRVRDAMAAAGFLRRPELVDPDVTMRWLELSSGWMLRDEEVTIDAEVTRRQLPVGGDGAFGVARRVPEVDLPPDEVLFGRMRTSLIAVLAQLGATANWHAIARERFDGTAPATPLGESERTFLTGRSLAYAAPVAVDITAMTDPSQSTP